MTTNQTILSIILLVLIISVVAICVEKWNRNKVLEKAEEGKSMMKRLLEKGEFRTEKTAISYTATIHRTSHIVYRPRPRGTGIRASCPFCEELLILIEDHFKFRY